MVGTIGTIEVIAERVAAVQVRIAAAAARSGKDPASLTLIAVTKTLDAETVRAASLAGLREVGENKVQEAYAKRGELLDQPLLHWHLIGHLQRNKARRAASTFDTIHSVDSLELATALNEAASAQGRDLPVFAQVNISGESTKSGFIPRLFSQQAAALARLPALRWRGLMTIAPEGADTETLRAVFAATRRLRDAAAAVFPSTTWNALSMGMTNDFEIAIEEGATHVRVGRAIFGERTETVRA
ncbi:MAG TPA: YggS family pyridoxal phosphate-dependent enzyme [Chloroflexota bacterium]|nr:YggS family pyridoxal phosphate-dependent enzyme [Chloroflexota bacterium]